MLLTLLMYTSMCDCRCALTMFSKSEGNIQQQQSMLGYSPAAQPMQFVLHPLIPANMPVVVDHVPRMPVTVLPAQPVTMSQPPRVNNKFVLQPSYQTNPSEPVQTTFTTLHLTPTTQGELRLSS